MKTRKYLALLMAVVMVVGVFAGCGGSKPAETPAAEPAAPAAEPAAPAAEPAAEPAVTVVPEKKSATVGGVKYSLSGSKATVIGVKNKNARKLTIPATIKANDKTYKVTAIKASACKNMKKLATLTIGKNVKTIGKNAFYGCKALKTIKIKTTKLNSTTVGSNAFKGIASKAKITCPSGKKSAYKKLLQKRGVGSKATFK